MRTWPTTFELERDGPLPLAVQIVRGITQRIHAGGLRSGEPLPSTRSLANLLGVHRNTVVAAFAELEAEGWITSRQGLGTFVSSDLPAPGGHAGQGHRTPGNPLGFDLPPVPSMPSPQFLVRPRGMLELLGGLPDPRLMPTVAIARALRRAMKDPALLTYGDPWGHPRLREALARMLGSVRGMAMDADQIVVTRGAQMAIALVARALLRPGDVVAVEELGYPPAWEALRLAGLNLVAVPIDDGGMRVDALADLASRRCLRAVYLTPHHQYPTTVALASARRVALLELARRERLLIIEDDYDSELHYEGRPILSLASADKDSLVVHIGTLSKVLAPGLRLGFVAAPREAAQALAVQRFYLDRQGDLALERALAELFEEGEIQRHVWRLHRVYRGRRDALIEALDKHLSDDLTFQAPPGGTAIWCRVTQKMDVDAWASRAWERGVAVQTSRQASLVQKPSTHLRLGFSRLDERELTQAVGRLAEARRGK